jgi:hypothetical protein
MGDIMSDTNNDLLPGGTVTPEPRLVVDVPKDERVKCEFCGCRLAPNGDVMSMSAQARTFRDLEEDLKRAKKDYVDRETELLRQIAENTDELERARAVLMQPAKKKSFWDD